VDLKTHAGPDRVDQTTPLLSPLHCPSRVMSKGGLGNFKAQTVMSKDGTEIFAEAVGDPAKPHVVFVHGDNLHFLHEFLIYIFTGVACTGAIFDPIFILAEMQAHIYAVSRSASWRPLACNMISPRQVRYDARGHGRSGKPETADAYISGCYADDFEAVCRAFNLRKPVFCGWYGRLCVFLAPGGSYSYRSLSGAISADLLSAAKIPLSGLIYLSALPCMGEIMGLVPTPLGLSYIPRLCAEGIAHSTLTI
jgi:pimeloyl-ACP methyl ester carboxylesterase